MNLKFKKYKHINGALATSDNDGHYYGVSGLLNTLPRNFIENTQDWKEFVGTSADDIDLYAGDKAFWVYLNAQNLSICHRDLPLVNIHNYNFTGKDWKIFSTEQAANKFIEENKPKPVFTTSDGVVINLGDKYWGITHNKYIECIKCHENSGKEFGRMYFSTEELAKEYLINNTILFSIEDLKSLYNGYKENNTRQLHLWIDTLKEAAKEKLNFNK